MKKIFWLFLLLTFLWGVKVFAAVGCDLNDPDRDVKRLFPNATSYKTMYMTVSSDKVFQDIQTRLGDSFKGIYETIDVPYTIYEIHHGQEKVGYIHGVNQKGEYGGIQVFLVLDLNGKILNFYFQRLTNQQAALLRSQLFVKQFIGLTLKDFAAYDVATGQAKANSKVARIKNPAPTAEKDFKAALRATKKNLILMDEFIFKKY